MQSASAAWAGVQDARVADDVSLEAIAQRTEGFSGDDISNMCRDAAFNVVRRQMMGRWVAGKWASSRSRPLLGCLQGLGARRGSDGGQFSQFTVRSARTTARASQACWPTALPTHPQYPNTLLCSSAGHSARVRRCSSCRTTWWATLSSLLWTLTMR